ncbi:peptidase, partial [Pseudomonas fragi]
VNGVAATDGLAAPSNGGITIEPTPGTPSAANASAPAEPQAPAVAERIVDGRTTYILNSILQDVIKKGTGRRALALGRADIA